MSRIKLNTRGFLFPRKGGAGNVMEKDSVQEIINGVPEGIRHDSAVRLVGRWYGKGSCRSEVSMALVMWNQLNSPPLTNQELKSIFQSTTKWEHPRLGGSINGK